jgi:hypothetical protein
MEYLFKNYKGSNKEQLTQIARIAVVVFTCVFSYLFRTVDYDKALNSGELAVTIVDSEDYKNEPYINVNQHLKLYGFKNIKNVPLGDLITGWLTKENTVDSVTIDGKPFVKGKIYKADKAVVVVKYHSK